MSSFYLTHEQALESRTRALTGAAPRSPLRTLAEMAEEFGVTMTHLRSAYGGDKTAPAPVFLKSGNLKAKYSQVEMRKWWAARSTK